MMLFEKKKLKECCISISDGDHQPPPKADRGIPFITISNIDNMNRIDFTNAMYVSEDYYSNLADIRKAKSGDILYTVVGSFGIPVYIDSDYMFVFQRHIAILRANKEVILPRYLYYILLNSEFYMKADYLAIGAAQRTLSLNALRNMEINIPPLEMQKKVVDILSVIDNKINTNKTINDNLEQIIRSIFEFWFTQHNFPNASGTPYANTDGIMQYNDSLKQNIPLLWNCIPLGELCSLKNGINYDKSLPGDKCFKIINVRNISSTTLLLDAEEFDDIYLTESQAKNYIVSTNDIIIARSGTPGATRLILNPTKKTIYCGFIICCTPHNPLHKLYLTYTLKQLEGTNATKTGGSILQNVSQDTLKTINVCVPPDTLLQNFNDTVSDKFELLISIIEENKKLIGLRDWLLPMLMNGQATIED